MMYYEEHKHGYNVRPDPLGRGARYRPPGCRQRPHMPARVLRARGDALLPAGFRCFACDGRTGCGAQPARWEHGCLHGDPERNYAGEWEEGLALVRQVLELDPHHPGWYRFAIVNDYYRKGEYKEALAEAQAINLPGYWPTHVMVAAAAGRLGRLAVATRAIDELLALCPEFAESGRVELGKWFADEKLLDEVMEGLRLAGLEVSTARLGPGRRSQVSHLVDAVPNAVGVDGSEQDDLRMVR